MCAFPSMLLLLFFSYDIFRYITDMFGLCCWLFEALQRVYGRSELLGLSIYNTETEVSVKNLAVNVASQVFDLILHICSMFGSSCCHTL